MDNNLELIFKIDGLSPDIVSMARLGKYINLLAKLYGNETQIHFDSVTKGSAKLNMTCDSHEVRQSVYEKSVALVQGIGAESDLKVYRKLNDLLREDNTFAETIIPHTTDCQVIKFPGVTEPKPQDMAPIDQHGSVQGELVLIGGKDSTINVELREPSGNVQNKIIVSKSLAKELAPLLFTSVRLNGVGTWYRSSDGEWIMKKFKAQSCESLSDESLMDVVGKTRMITSKEWDAVENPFEELRKLRD